MKSAKQWSDEFCRKYIINARDNPVEVFVDAIQKDAIFDLTNRINALNKEILLLKNNK